MTIKIFSYNELLDELYDSLQKYFRVRPGLKVGLINPQLLKPQNQDLIKQAYQQSMTDWYKRNDIQSSIPAYKDDITYVAIYKNDNNHTGIIRLYPFGIDTCSALIFHLIKRPKGDNVSQTVLNNTFNDIFDDWFNGIIINHLMKYLDVNRSSHDIQDIIKKSLTTDAMDYDPFNLYVKFTCKLNHLNHELAHRIKSKEKLATLSTSKAPIYTIRYNPATKEYTFLTTLY